MKHLIIIFVALIGLISCKKEAITQPSSSNTSNSHYFYLKATSPIYGGLRPSLSLTCIDSVLYKKYNTNQGLDTIPSFIYAGGVSGGGICYTKKYELRVGDMVSTSSSSTSTTQAVTYDLYIDNKLVTSSIQNGQSYQIDYTFK